MGYINNGYVVHCITCSRYKDIITRFCADNKINHIHFYYTDSASSLALLKIPVLGTYIHYYAWLLKARGMVKKLVNNKSFSHAHHVTYSSIKFGTPLYNLDLKTVLGPLGGGTLPDSSLRKYLGKHFFFELFKNTISNALSIVNPTVSKSIRTADQILVSNDVAEKQVTKYTATPTVKMFDAGLADYFENDYKEKELGETVNILWIGRMLPRKGLNLAIETVAHLPKDFKYHFYIVGDGPLMDSSKKEVQKYNLQNTVSFLGKLPHNHLKSVFEQSHLLLFPSLIDSCPMQVFEAMANALPVVTLNHQGMKEQVVEGSGIKIDITNKANYPKKLAEGIVALTQDKKTYTSYSLNAWKFGQQQLWKFRIKNFIDQL